MENIAFVGGAFILTCFFLCLIVGYLGFAYHQGDDQQPESVYLRRCDEMVILKTSFERDSVDTDRIARTWYLDHLHLLNPGGWYFGIKFFEEVIEELLLTSSTHTYSYRPNGQIIGMIVFNLGNFKQPETQITMLHFRSEAGTIDSDTELRVFLTKALSVYSCEVLIEYRVTNIPRKIFLDVGFHELAHGMSWIPPSINSTRQNEVRA